MRKITITAWLAIFDPFWTMINLLIFYDLFPGDGDVWYGKKEDVWRCQNEFPYFPSWNDLVLAQAIHFSSWTGQTLNWKMIYPFRMVMFFRNSVKLPEGSMHVKLNILWTLYIYIYMCVCV